jgi:hypothetical protein
MNRPEGLLWQRKQLCPMTTVYCGSARTDETAIKLANDKRRKCLIEDPWNMLVERIAADFTVKACRSI